MPASGSGFSHRLGRYHLSECLGGGPTGEVYRAKVYGVAGMDREFAVKKFHPSFVSGSAAGAAIKIAAQQYGELEHPKIARLHEFGVGRDFTFTAVEFVSGIDLAQLASQGRLSLGAAARLVEQVCRGVGFAHGRGLHHLGLAPTNLICSEKGEIKVTDFGFLPARLPSRPAEDSSLQARLCYLSPEQLEGQTTSSASDVYQLGTIAFELMVGRKPYAGRSGEALGEQMLAGVVPESGLPAQFETLLQRALARSPQDRYRDASAMADAISAALRATPTLGSLTDAGKAVTAYLVLRQKGRESQASGVLSFPIPAPPRISRSEAMQSAGTKQPQEPLDCEATVLDDADFITEPAEEATLPSISATRPEVSGLLLGPAGTDERATRGQFIGGTQASSAHALPQKLSPCTASVDSADTVVNKSPEEAIDPTADQVFDRALTLAIDEIDLVDEFPAPLPPPSPALPPAIPREAARKPAPDANLPSPVFHVEQEVVDEAAPLDAGAPLDAKEVAPDAEGVALDAKEVAPDVEGVPELEVDQPQKPGLPRLFYVGVAAFIGAAAVVSLGSWLLPSDSAEPTTQALAGDASIAATSILLDASIAATPIPLDASIAATPILFDASQPSVHDAAVAVAQASLPQDAAVEAATSLTAEVSGALQIVSKPEGAKAYLDGTLVGITPVQLDGSPDSHRISLILPGYDLYTGTIQGSGIFKMDLTEVTPPEGPGGIKVRCRKKNRYYVFVDSKPVGQLCPSERIGVAKGDHVVEIYDPITDARRAFNVTIKDTRLSLRVRVD